MPCNGLTGGGHWLGNDWVADSVEIPLFPFSSLRPAAIFSLPSPCFSLCVLVSGTRLCYCALVNLIVVLVDTLLSSWAPLWPGVSGPKRQLVSELSCALETSDLGD